MSDGNIYIIQTRNPKSYYILLLYACVVMATELNQLHIVEICSALYLFFFLQAVLILLSAALVQRI